MAKYELSGNFEDHDLDMNTSNREIAIQNKNIANELAEANRLKTIEIQIIAEMNNNKDSEKIIANLLAELTDQT